VEFEILFDLFPFSFSTTHGVAPFSHTIHIVHSHLIFMSILDSFPPERARVPHLPPLLPSRTYSTASYHTHGLGIFFPHLPTHVLVVVLTHFRRTYYLSTYLAIVPTAGTPARAETKQRVKGRKIKKIALAETYITFVPLPITLHPRTRLLIIYYYYYYYYYIIIV